MLAQRIPATVSYRLGSHMASLIKRVVPKLCPGNFDSAKPDETLFLPVLFERLPDWSHSEMLEVLHSEFFFAHALTIVAVEMLILKLGRESPTPRDGLIVVSFLNSLLDCFEKLLHT